MKGIEFAGKNAHEIVGKELGSTLLWEQYREQFSIIHYVSGIDIFDEYFKDIKFHETDAILKLISCTNAILFVLEHDGKRKVFGIYRNQIKELKTEDNVEISVRTINRVTKTLKSFMGAAPIIVGSIADSFVKIGSRRVQGKIYRLIVVENEKECEIVFTSPDENNNKSAVDEFVNVHLKNTLPVQDKKCFVATACYGDSDAPEVLILRQFRDSRLLTNPFGSLFVAIYYTTSPFFATIISKSDRLKGFVRQYFLHPLVTALQRQNKNG